MQIAQVMGGYSLGQADLLRRAMGKKQAEAMAEHRVIFVEGSKERGFDAKKAEAIFDLLAQFAAYGFNKSHSAAYGYISYQTAWLKANYRAEYMAALMSIESGNTDKILVYIGDCKRSGIEIRPPDVNLSQHAFDVLADDRGAIRYGLGAVKGVGRSAVEALIEAREDAGGRFRDLLDCLERLDYGRVNKKFLESLVKAGAFDWTGHHRAKLMAALDSAVSYAQREQADKKAGQVGLFAMMGGGKKGPGFRMPEAAEWSLGKELNQEREAIGFFLSGHPVTSFKKLVDAQASGRIAGLDQLAAETQVRVAATVAAVRVVRTKRGDRMAFVTIDDETGSVECVFFSSAWAECSRDLSSDQPVMLTGKLEKSAEGVKIMGESVELLSELQTKATRKVIVQLEPQDLKKRRLEQLATVLDRHSGSCPIWVEIGQWQSTIGIELSEERRVLPGEELKDEVAALLLRRDVVRFE
jgi:DNA polymerase-3 subunit alpha